MRRVAYHEAGHIVAAGPHFYKAELYDGTSGIVHVRWPKDRDPLAYATCCVAGPLSEGRASRQDLVTLLADRDCSADWDSALAAVGLCGMPMALDGAVDLLRARWRDIEIIATALYERGVLTRDDVQMLLRPTWRRPIFSACAVR
jgi:hypothetical protein